MTAHGVLKGELTRSIRQSRGGFTLCELVVTLLLFTIIVALMLPAIQLSRTAARSAQCKENLRQIGVALHVYAARDSNGRLCSGAFDMVRDGAVDRFGWIADVISVGDSYPQQLLCPTSQYRGSEVLNDLIDPECNVTGAGLPVNRRGITGPFTSQLISATPETSPTRVEIAAQMVADGYNTNYAASWFLVRAQCRTTKGSDGVFRLSGKAYEADLANGSSTIGFQQLQNTCGPLTLRQLEFASVPSSNIPILGDASARKSKHSVLTHSLNAELVAGSLLSQSFNDGPAYWDAARNKIVHLNGDHDTAPVTTEVEWTQPDKSWPRVGDNMANASTMAQYKPANDKFHRSLILQDTRGFLAVHLGVCNLLMADGSVKSPVDRNGDGFLNPGFPVAEPSLSKTQMIDRHGYSDGVVELASWEIYMGTLLRFEGSCKGSFE